MKKVIMLMFVCLLAVTFTAPTYVEAASKGKFFKKFVPFTKGK